MKNEVATKGARANENPGQNAPKNFDPGPSSRSGGKAKVQISLRLERFVLSLIQLVRIKEGCSQAVAVELLVVRGSTSPEAKKLIQDVIDRDPLLAAVHSAGVEYERAAGDVSDNSI